MTESLTQCLTFEAEYSLLNAAKSRGNERVVMELDGRDAIALEVRYHPTCYQDFTHKKSLERVTERQLEDEDKRGNSSAHKTAFEGLIPYLDGVLSNPTAVVT